MKKQQHNTTQHKQTQVFSDFVAAMGSAVLGGVFSDLVAARGWVVVGGVFSGFVAAMGLGSDGKNIF